MNRQGLCGPGKNGVLPIFSRRKRPRQAVYADPSLNGQSSSEQLQTDNRQTARSSNCFSYYNSSKSQSAKKTELGSSVDKRTEQSHQATKPPYNTANRQYAPPLIRHPGQNQQLQNKGMHYAQAQHAETRQISQLTDRPRNRSYVQNSSNNHHDRSYSQQNFSNNNNIQPRSILKQPQGFNSNRQLATSNFHTHPFQQHSKNQSLALNTVTSHGYCNAQALAINRQDPIGPLRPQELPAVDNTKPKPKIDHETDDVRIKTAADDKSLRILTASIEGMLHWKKSTKLNLLFEVYVMDVQRNSI
ncbi:putative uncharacterized protein DDB_G0279653 isoform X2 [Ptychodera flava]|uniref:putative uncharacterized protein DDB_G0279653 isoform X2 n=1 Tax=Ptychodera flava TaxID=63121 RepID=UPI00396A3885